MTERITTNEEHHKTAFVHSPQKQRRASGKVVETLGNEEESLSFGEEPFFGGNGRQKLKNYTVVTLITWKRECSKKNLKLSEEVP